MIEPLAPTADHPSTRLDNIEQADADHAAKIINGQRRRHLGYQSPTMLYTAATATVH